MDVAKPTPSSRRKVVSDFREVWIVVGFYLLDIVGAIPSVG